MMGRKLLIGPKNVIEGIALAVNTTGDTTDCDFVDLVSYDVVWANGAALDAVVTCEYSNDDKTWITIGFGNPIPLAGASGSHRIDIEPNFKYVRPAIAFVAGNADIKIVIKGTTKGA